MSGVTEQLARLSTDDRSKMDSVAGMVEIEVELQVRRALLALVEATLNGDVEAVLAAYRQDAPYVEQGRIIARFDEMEEAIREFFSTHRVTENTLQEIRVMVLGPDAAVVSARFSYSTISRDGTGMTNAGAWTATFARNQTGWRIIAPHQSTMHPQTRL